MISARTFLSVFYGTLICLACHSLSTNSVYAEEPLDFTRDIRPILSNKCFHCHGPDENKREGGLRFDTKAGPFAESDSGEPAIVPGKPAESELYRRLTTKDDSEIMPPADTGSQLKPEEIEKVRKWLQQGGHIEGHWSYQKLVRPKLPEVQNKKWVRNDIDRFILARLEAEGLAPAAEASRETLIRRLSLDLTGLPPTPQEVTAFLNDKTPQAYERMVDRLLASPTYGEHWARSWLDLSRYADSAGYADDPPRTIWAFRDYVIKSLNENKPFDQFTIEQLAGDLLENPTDEQFIATAFHRNTLTNNEGGTNDEEFRNAAIIDRVNTTFAVWMGTTMTCANCHTHKFDPISQKEFFQIFAILNNTEDADKRDESPFLQYFTQKQKQQKKDWQQQLEKLKTKLKTSTPQLLASQKKWEARINTPLKWTATTLQQATSSAKTVLQIRDKKSVFVKQASEKENYEIRLLPASSEKKSTAKKSTTKWTAIQLATLPNEILPGNGAGLGGGNFVVTRVSANIEPVGNRSPKVRYVRIEIPGKQKILSLAEVQVFSGGNNVALQGVAIQSSTTSAGPAKLAIDGNTDGDYFTAKSTSHTATTDNPWWEVNLNATQSVDRIVIWNRTDNNLHTRLSNFRIKAIGEDKKVIWETTIKESPNPSKAFSLSISRPVEMIKAFADYQQPGFEASFVLDKKDPNKRGWAVAGQLDQPHMLTLIPKKPFSLQTDEQLVIRIEQQSPHGNHNLGHFQFSLTNSPIVSEIAQAKPEILKLVRLPAKKRSSEDQQKLTKYYVANIAPELNETRKQIAKLEQSVKDQKPYTTVPVMKQLPGEKYRKSFVQIRGNYKSLGEAVQPGLLSAFHAPPKKKGLPDRLDLAKWLIDKNNPLTPRVIANRFWEKLFGIGLVSTSEEFGSQGELPSHPKLINWLAAELLRLQWDQKAFIKTIVMSATYRQDSVITDEKLERDPKNRLLSRGARFRLSAEMVRDQALAVSGLLSHKMYGPPVKPAQPSLGLSAAFGSKIDWQTSSGEDQYRRGLYTTWRRSNPYPSMAAFDAPNRETCTLKRERTNTPLQAFVTLNDPVYVEAAQALGRRMAAHSGNLNEQIKFGFQLCTARQPQEKELQRLVQLFNSTTQKYQKDAKAATELATNPIGPLPQDANPAEFAAWTLLGNVLLNLDEVLMRP